MEECEETGRSITAADEADPESYYRRFSQVWQLDEVRIALLRDLSAWRERTCRQQDISRNRLLRNEVLLTIAERMPKSLQQLDSIIKRGRVVREYGQKVLELIAAAPESARTNPPAPIDRPLHYVWNKRLKQLRAIGRKAAETHDLLPEILLRKRDLDALIRSRDEEGHYHLPPSLSGWRKPLVGDALLKRIEEFETS